MGANRPGVRFKKRLKRAKREMERLERKAGVAQKGSAKAGAAALVKKTP